MAKGARLQEVVLSHFMLSVPEAVAEHALALIMTLNRKTHKAYDRAREGNFNLNFVSISTLH